MRFGAHMSIAGGVDRAVDRAAEAGCDALQLFTKNARQWAARPLTEEEVTAFRRKREELGIGPAVAHAAYLINLASGEQELWERCWRACAEELERSARLGLDGLIVHPGAHGGDGEEAGLRRVARGVERILAAVPGGPPLLLEVTAGQGTALGGRLEHLAWLLERLGDHGVGVCLDTCHLHAAGYALDSPEACRETLDAVEGIIGLGRVRVLHCNDSQGAAGSNLDRHTHIGVGTIGGKGFATLLTDPRVAHLPAILETPKQGEWDRVNLARLRALHRGEEELPPPPEVEDERP